MALPRVKVGLNDPERNKALWMLLHQFCVDAPRRNSPWLAELLLYGGVQLVPPHVKRVPLGHIVGSFQSP